MIMVNINGVYHTKFTIDEAIHTLEGAIGCRVIPVEVLWMAIESLKQQKDMVYCRDCRWFKQGGAHSYCAISRGNHPKEDGSDYCSYAVRKDGSE